MLALDGHGDTRKDHGKQPSSGRHRRALCLPPGRKSIEERTSVYLRESDRQLLKRGIKLFPITLGPMRKLTVRWHALEGKTRGRKL
jgi:hypothetical protein